MFDDPRPGDTVVFTKDQMATDSGTTEAMRLAGTYRVLFRDESGTEVPIYPKGTIVRFELAPGQETTGEVDRLNKPDVVITEFYYDVILYRCDDGSEELINVLASSIKGLA